MYDLVAGIQCLKSSYVLSKTKALELFPMLKKDKLVGAIVYYDGQSGPVVSVDCTHVFVMCKRGGDGCVGASWPVLSGDPFFGPGCT